MAEYADALIVFILQTPSGGTPGSEYMLKCMKKLKKPAICVRVMSPSNNEHYKLEKFNT